ncbi:MAG: DUF4870 domain-containing protein [Syntrophobacterales bacterium]|jgi:uncharacterized membrane protein|nr:DUF4870 domain-containing protein [Syntrophobacterales bacterium]
MEEKEMQQETSLGMDQSFEALLSYSFGWATGIIFLVMEKNNEFVRFHAMQSVFAFVGLTVMMIVLFLIPHHVGLLIAACLWFVGVALWAVLMWKAYKGEWFGLPLIGNFARNFSKKSSVVLK